MPSPIAQRGHKKIGGRQKGTPNRLTKTVRSTVLEVFNKLQNESKENNLEAFAKRYPRDFYQIAARLIPTEITGALQSTVTVLIKKNSTELTTEEEEEKPLYEFIDDAKS